MCEKTPLRKEWRFYVKITLPSIEGLNYYDCAIITFGGFGPMYSYR